MVEDDSEIFVTQSFEPLRLADPSPFDYNLVITGPKGGRSLDMMEMARFLRAAHVIYDDPSWRRFDGRIYSQISQDYLDQMIYRTYEQVGFVPTTSQINSLIRYVKAILTPEGVDFPEDMGDIAQDYSLSENTTDRNIVFRNGILNIFMGNKIMRPFTPYLYVTNYLHADYDELITYSGAEQILDGILPDEETKRFFFEMCGYIFFDRDMDPPAIFSLYGPGNTGKSALHHMIANVLGAENVSTLGIGQITQRFMLAELYGKMLNVCGETGGSNRRETGIDGEMLKRLSDGQIITAEEKGKKPFQMRNTAKLLFVTNTAPDFGDNSSGLYRRLYTILCDKEQDPDKKIYNILTSDGAACWLINKSMDAYDGWISNHKKFHLSDSVKTELEMYQRQNPFLAYFYDTFGSSDIMEIRLKLVADDELRYLGNLYQDYVLKVHEMGLTPLSKSKFGERVRIELRLAVKHLKYPAPNTATGWTTKRGYTLPDQEIDNGYIEE